MTALPAHDMGPAANTFRKEVRDWLAKHWTPEKQAAHRRNGLLPLISSANCSHTAPSKLSETKYSARSCGTTPIMLLARCGSDQIEAPATKTSPASGLSRPAMIEMAVVLPAPFGPSKP